ncbi:uncharacterized protein LOC143837716 [Paroedura picta]|uniref:uncharacterized protein LOC143837716 n=1 Tax=Paroedura picta TaxID=143630 RepID=UPI00405735C9
MTHARQTSKYFLLFSYHNVTTVAEDDIHVRYLAIPGGAEQMEINVSSVTCVGRQLAMIGDEYNRTYSRKLEDSLFCLAKGVFQTCIWSNFKGVAMKTFGSIFKQGWRKIIDPGYWILWVPLKYVYRRWVPATVFALLMWCLVIYDLQD